MTQTASKQALNRSKEWRKRPLRQSNVFVYALKVLCLINPKYAVIELSYGADVYIPIKSFATIGKAFNEFHFLIILGKDFDEILTQDFESNS
jgi:hypothetical protein